MVNMYRFKCENYLKYQVYTFCDILTNSNKLEMKALLLLVSHHSNVSSTFPYIDTSVAK